MQVVEGEGERLRIAFIHPDLGIGVIINLRINLLLTMAA